LIHHPDRITEKLIEAGWNGTVPRPTDHKA
jgi:hypothetical protein